MAVRNIIKIDEDLCNGCGDCVTGCPEGALAIVDGKAKLVQESYCDGLGACIGECPTGALIIEQREADDFDEAAVEAHMAAEKDVPLDPASKGEATECTLQGHAARSGRRKPALHTGCPGAAARVFEPRSKLASDGGEPASGASQLGHWPIQLHLINPAAPAYQCADVLIAADCTAFSYGRFHDDWLAGRALIIACPKLDQPTGYTEKLAALFAEAQPASVTVMRMQVPCCTGLVRLAAQARDRAGSTLPIHEVVVGLDGGIISETKC